MDGQKYYFEILDMAEDEQGNKEPAGMTVQVAQEVTEEELLEEVCRLTGLDASRIRRITEEEYKEAYGEGDVLYDEDWEE